MTRILTIRIAGNSPNCGDFRFSDGVMLGQVFDQVGGSPREGFRASHTLVVRRWCNVKPYSITMPLDDPRWREFPLLDRDHVIYQYDVESAENTE